MEPFEAIRRTAAELHSAAVARGADPWQPMTLAAHAAAELDCSIEAVPAGDPLLRGGRALYDPDLRMIVHEQADPGTSAFLIGHELGHVAVHRPGEVVVAVDVDPARLNQSAGGAIDVVGDYGRKARREVQMDLFGREFVLPRERARQLYIEDGLAAAEIAKRTGLPFALVAQQILDSVLLPEAVEEIAPSSRVPLNAKQEEAARHQGSPFQLQAGPGTGKTRTLIDRVERLIDDPGVDPTTILILTFSNKAAGELTERLARSRPAEAGAVWAGTFHAFGLDLIRRYHDRLGLPDDPALVDKAEAIGILEELVPSLPLKHYRNLYDPTLILSDVLSGISRAKDEVVDAAAYAGFVERVRRPADEPEDEFRPRLEKLQEVAAIYAAYEAQLEARQRLDFGDLIMTPVLLLEDPQGPVEEVRQRHRHVLIDEYQDVNRASIRMVKALAGDGKNLWAVGDTRQSIYRFRGASSANLTAFARDFPDPRIDRLQVNYRSSQEIVSAFSAFAGTMQVSKEPGILEMRLDAEAGASGVTPEFRQMQRPEDEPAAIAKAILDLKDAGVPLRDQAVLCRGNARLAKVAAALEARDVPILYLGSLFEREEVKDLLALISLLADPRASGLVRTATQARYAMPLNDVRTLLDHAQGSARPLDWLDGAEEQVSSEQSRHSLAHLRADLAGKGIATDPWHFLVDLILDRSGFARTLASSSGNRERMKSIALWQFLGFCRSAPKVPGAPVPRLLERVRRMVLLSDERDLRQMPDAAAGMDAVRLLTVHGSKGLEFGAVHLAGVSAGSFPVSSGGSRCPPPDGMIFGSEGLSGPEAVKRGKEAEEECLFFVGLSRAKRHLLLYSPTQQADGKKRNPSAFLNHLAGHYESVPSAPLHLPSQREPDGDMLPVDGFEGPLTDRQVGSFEDCPRRFFYTHVLGVPGTRTATPFLKLHDAVHDLFGWLREEPERWNLEREAIMTQFEEAWQRKGPVGVGYEEDYRAAARSLVTALLDSRDGGSFAEARPIELQLGGTSVAVTPDEVRIDGGAHVLRRVRTGKLGKTELDDDLAYGLYALAAAERFGPTARVEAIHLTGGTVTPVELTPRKLDNRRNKAGQLGQRIRAGDFPLKRDDRKCPRCPHFFICGPVPPGPIH